MNESQLVLPTAKAIDSAHLELATGVVNLHARLSELHGRISGRMPSSYGIGSFLIQHLDPSGGYVSTH